MTSMKMICYTVLFEAHLHRITELDMLSFASHSVLHNTDGRFDSTKTHRDMGLLGMKVRPLANI